MFKATDPKADHTDFTIRIQQMNIVFPALVTAEDFEETYAVKIEEL